MLVNHGRSALFIALAAATLAFPAAAEQLSATSQQIALGQAATFLSAQQAATPVAFTAVVQDNFVTETSGRPWNPAAGERARSQMRTASEERRPARYAARRCASLGCPGVHVLGVGY